VLFADSPSTVLMLRPATDDTGVWHERIGTPSSMDRAGAAQGRTTAEFGAGHADFISDDPQQWRIGIRLGRHRLAVQLETGGHRVSCGVVFTLAAKRTVTASLSL
jgi:hypothetical protein